MSRITGLVGKTYHQLTILKETSRKDNLGKNRTYVLCQCSCGNIKYIKWNSICTNYTKSCGCYRKIKMKLNMTTHGLRYHPLNYIWNMMKQRCLNHNNKQFKDYGGRGISIDEAWFDFKIFYDWAMKNGWTKGLTIDRINNDGNYCPENCRFTTYKEQNNNRRSNVMITAFGETKNISQWEKDSRCNICRDTIRKRLKSGLVGDAIFITNKNQSI